MKTSDSAKKPTLDAEASLIRIAKSLPHQAIDDKELALALEQALPADETLFLLDTSALIELAAQELAASGSTMNDAGADPSTPISTQPIVYQEAETSSSWAPWIIPLGVGAIAGIVAALDSKSGGSDDSSNKVAPVITSNGGGETAEISILENRTSITSVRATDTDSTSLTYSISGGADKDLFNINATSGALSFKSAADFETKADADGNNIYDVIVQVSDGKHIDTQTLAISVTNKVVEAVADTYTVSEDGTLTVAAADGVLKNDVREADPITASLVRADNGVVYVNADGSFTYTPNKDFTGTDTFTYKVTDGTNTDTATVTITVTAVNDGPVANDQSFSIAENSANGTAVGTIIVTDPDSGDSKTFAIVSGNDNDTFALDTATGKLTVADLEALDFETHPQFFLTISVTDEAGLSDTAVITINLTDVAEAAALGNDQAAALSYQLPEDPFLFAGDAPLVP